jgi:hypothetical protein
MVRNQPGQIVCETLCKKKTSPKRAGGVAQVKALSSKTSIAKKKKKKKELKSRWIGHRSWVLARLGHFGPPTKK